MTRLQLRRVIYLAAMALVFLGGAGGLGAAFVTTSAMASRMHGLPSGFWIIAIVPVLLALATFAALIWVFLFLARRPQAWGKLVCLVGLPWIMLSGNAWLIAEWGGGFVFTPLDAVPGVIGFLLLCCAITLLVVDRGAVLSYRPTAD